MAEMFNRLFVLTVAFFCTTIIGNAASSSWQDLGGGEARLLAQLDPNTGKIDAAIQVRLNPGWSTYWRYPGSSGIPPVFDFSGSDGINFEEVQFPAPALLGEKELRYAGYKKSVTFPVSGKIQSGIKSNLHLKLTIGICSRICIPAQTEMEINHEELLQTDLTAMQMINMSKLAIPRVIEQNSELLNVGPVIDQTLRISITHNKSNHIPSLFVEGPSNWFLEPAKLLETDERRSVFTLDISRAPKDVDILSQRLTYTYVSGSTGMEFTK